MNAIAGKIVLAKQQAADGVDYSPRYGALCPWCGKKARITATRPWDESTRIRYHRCESSECVLSALRVNIKSVEADR